MLSFYDVFGQRRDENNTLNPESKFQRLRKFGYANIQEFQAIYAYIWIKNSFSTFIHSNISNLILFTPQNDQLIVFVSFTFTHSLKASGHVKLTMQQMGTLHLLFIQYGFLYWTLQSFNKPKCQQVGDITYQGQSIDETLTGPMTVKLILFTKYWRSQIYNEQNSTSRWYIAS